MKIFIPARNGAMLLSSSTLAVAAALALPGSGAHAQDCVSGSNGICTVVVTQDDTDLTISAPAVVVNQADGTSINKTQFFNYLLVQNEAGASIDSLVLATPASPQVAGFNPSGTTIVNAGAIDGGLLLPAGSVYVNAGGTVNGTFATPFGSAESGSQMFFQGFNTQTFIDRTDTGAGNFDPGHGVDYLITSYSGAGNFTHVLETSLPTHFEVGGAEALDTETNVTLVNDASGSAAGVALWGRGSFVNNATITPISGAGSGAPTAGPGTTAVAYFGVAGDNSLFTVEQFDFVNNRPVFLSFGYGNALESFTNLGSIDGDLVVRTANFSNEGTIDLGSVNTLIFAAADRAFTFENTGTISADNAVARQTPGVTDMGVSLVSALDSTVAAPVTILNSGSIGGGLLFNGFASTFTFDNSGTIDIAGNPGQIDRAVEIDITEIEVESNGEIVVPQGFLIGAGELVAESASVTNSGDILGGIEAELTARTVTFSNTGNITRDPNDFFAGAVEIEVDDFDGPDGDDTVSADFFSFENTGNIDGATDLDLSVTLVEFSNSGTMIGLDLPLAPELFPTQIGALEIEVETTLGSTVNFANTGTIRTADLAAAAVEIEVEAGDLDSGVAGAADALANVTVTNSGTIATTGGIFLTPGGFVGLPQNQFIFNSAVALGVYADGEGGSTISIVNEADGTISSRGSGYIGNPSGGSLIPNQNELSGGSAVVAAAETVTIFNAGTIVGGVGVTSLTLPNGIVFVAETELDLEDVVGGAIDTFGGNDTITNEATGYIGGGIATRSGNDRIINFGTIEGTVQMGEGNDTFNNAGTFEGTLLLGNGNDVFTLLLADAPQFNATVNGGAGGDSFIYVVTEGGSLQDALSGRGQEFEYVAIGGTGTVTSDGNVAMGPIQVAGGAITLAEGSTLTASGEFALKGDAPTLAQNFTNRGTITGSVSLGEQDDTFAKYGTLTGNLDLGIGNDTFIQGINAILTGIADGGAGTDSFFLDVTAGGEIDRSIYDKLFNFEALGLIGDGSVTIGGDNPMPIVVAGAGTVTLDETAVIDGQGGNAITGTETGNSVANAGTVNGDVDLGNGDNQLSNTGTVNGNVTTGTGSDQLANNSGATIIGDVSTGDGGDMVSNAGTIMGDVGTGAGDDELANGGTIDGNVALDGEAGTAPPATVALAVAPQFRLTPAALVPAQTGGDDIFTNVGIVTGNVDAGAGDDSFSNSGTVQGNVAMGTGNDTLVLSGTIGGNISLGEGNDVLELQPGWAIGGAVSGDAGTDELRASFTGTTAAPTEVNFSTFNGFEQYSHLGGVAALSGMASLGQINVDAGRLIGRAGSSLTGNVAVASGATFGSAGVVNGNIAVAGTLSPGASPGTMTVNGNVALAGGSTLLMEFTPAASDMLAISGTLTIASGANLVLTGDRPLTPGTYNLVTATGGITGTFGTNVTRDSTVLGVLAYTANAIQLRSLFQLGAGATVQTGLTTAYINSLLAAGTATPGILAAFPALVDNTGFVNEDVVDTLSPEAYASVVQMGIENGLMIARSLRAGSAQVESGLFLFGQAYGGQRDFNPDSRGLSGSNIDTLGYLGGVGFGAGGFDVSVFVGNSDSDQRIRTLGVRSESDGLFYGGRVRGAFAGFRGGASVVFDRAEAETARTLGFGPAATSAYDLHGTTYDAWLAYDFAIGSNFAIGPQVGITRVEVERDGFVEGGGGAFALTVGKQEYDATFLTGDIRASITGDAMVRPWIEGGVRHQADGDPIIATGFFAGTPTGFTVAGAERDETLGHVGAGFDADIGTNVGVYLQGDIEFGNDSAQSVNGGVRIRF